MKEIIILIPAFALGYIVFMSILIVMVRLFFPFFTKEELIKRRKLRPFNEVKLPSAK